MTEGWVFYAAAVPAVIFFGLAKGGFSGLSLISLPLLALVSPPIRAAAIMLPILIVQDVVSVWAYRRDFERRVVVILVSGATLGIGIATVFASRVSDAAVLLFVGVIGAGFVLYSWLPRAAHRKAARPARIMPGLFWGACCGFTSFLANAGGPPFQVYTLPLRLKPQTYAGCQTMVFAVVNLIKIAAFFTLGQVSFENFAISATLFPVAIVATLAGVWLVRRVQSDAFYKIVYGLTLVIGLKLIWSGASGLGWI